MNRNTKIAAALLVIALPLTGCTTNPDTGERSISKTAIGGIGGALGGHLLRDLLGGRRARTENIR